jgi:epsilon-lactone hydrolase
MPKTILKGSFSHKMRGLGVLMRVSASVIARRVIKRPLVQEWSIPFEIGTLFWRAQFNHAFSLADIKEGRAYLDACYSVLDPNLDVEIRPNDKSEPRGEWFIPRSPSSNITLLYFHGGGYTFYMEVSRHFIALLAQTLGISIFAPDYRLTPESPHPAQLEDSLAAYKYLLAKGHSPEKLIISGDSAGGHLVLMSLLKLRQEQLPQPALAIGLSPWTDIGRRGESQFGNDRYDMVQGYQTLQFATWLKGNSTFTDTELSPIYQDYRGLAPIYLQAGGKEILVDMIRDFAKAIEKQGSRVRLDIWEHMTHEFHGYGEHLPESREALECIRRAIAWAQQSEGQQSFSTTAQTEVNSL